jgi:hypothetical protein
LLDLLLLFEFKPKLVEIDHATGNDTQQKLTDLRSEIIKSKPVNNNCTPMLLEEIIMLNIA